MHEFYIEFYTALASSLGESCRGEHRGTVILSLCMVLTLFIVQTGSDKQKSSIIHELYFAFTSFSGDSCTSEHMSSIRHLYAWY